MVCDGFRFRDRHFFVLERSLQLRGPVGLQADLAEASLVHHALNVEREFSVFSA